MSFIAPIYQIYNRSREVIQATFSCNLSHNKVALQVAPYVLRVLSSVLFTFLNMFHKVHVGSTSCDMLRLRWVYSDNMRSIIGETSCKKTLLSSRMHKESSTRYTTLICSMVRRSAYNLRSFPSPYSVLLFGRWAWKSAQ